MPGAATRAQTSDKTNAMISILIVALLMLPMTQMAQGSISSEKQIGFSGSIAKIETSTYLGVSSICKQQGRVSPYALSSIDEVIAVMNKENLNIWRMSFEPTFNDWQTFIQYYLDNCPYDLIVDPNHYFNQHLMTSSEWNTGTQRSLQILAAFSDYQDRIWIEPQNEQLADITTYTQNFVNAVRQAGYTNNIVSNVFWRPEPVTYALQKMATIKDPLDKFWTGQHLYWSETTESYAKTIMQEALNRNLKIINTEVGADAREIAYFTQANVDMLSDFLQWCADRGIGNTVWLMYGDYDYPTYQNFGLEFPTIT